MKRWYLLCLPLTTTLLGGCVVLDPDMPHDRGRAVGQHTHCPPGQERKGNCTPEGGFVPPGHQQDGRSIER